MAYDPKEGGMRRPTRKPEPQEESWASRPVKKSAPAQRQPVREKARPARQTSPLYDDFDSLYDQPIRQLPAPKVRKKRHSLLWGLVTLLLLCAELALVLLMAPQLLGSMPAGLDFLPRVAFAGGTVLTWDAGVSSSFESLKRTVETDRLMAGIAIDGVDVGGMTLTEARAAVEAVEPAGGGAFSVTVNSDGKSWTIDSDNIPMTRDIDRALRIAYAAGRQNTTDARSQITPAQERQAAALRLSSAPMELTTSLTWDAEAVRARCGEIAAEVSVAPVSAEVSDFNFRTRKFTISKDQSGQQLDADALYEAVLAVLNSDEHTGQVAMEPEKVVAEVTQSELQSSMVKISSYTTTTTSNSNRNTNIRLSAEAINGTVVLPGETFSFNNTTGQRTEAKGYKEASAISGGTTSPEIGGGVCQTSSTLFNAVARANMEIVTRSPHAWPSSYVAEGMDATVNWPGLDFQFRNSSDWPIYICASYGSRKVTVDIYGYTLGAGITIDLEHKQTQTLLAPSGVKEVQNPELAPGTRQKTVSARNGSVWETYQVWYRNGKEFKRELLCTSTYKAYQETVEYN